MAEVRAAGGDALALAGDVTDEHFAHALVELATGRFGGLDVAFNNAGALGEMAPLPEISRAGWEHTLAPNLTSAYLAAKAQVNALLPGGTDTPMGQSVASTPEARSFIANLFALKRIVAPEEIAKAALFLASDASSFVTGTALLADGGVSINRA